MYVGPWGINRTTDVMGKTICWFGSRTVREKGTWLSLVILLICCMILSGGVTRRNTLNLDISTLNVAYATSYKTMEEFTAWFNLWQFQRLMGAFGHCSLFAVAVRLLPRPSSPEVRIPVAYGCGRGQMWLGGAGCYFGPVILLSLGIVLLGAVFSKIHLAEDVSILYYFRCILLHIWRDVGFASLALLLAQVSSNRALGICISFGVLMLFSILGTNGILDGTSAQVLASRLYRQDGLWMWQPEMAAKPQEMMFFFLFPVVSAVLANIAGWLRYRGDLR